MARVACSPALWGDVLYERILDEIADAGYQGAELDERAWAAFDRQRGRLRALAEERSLRLSAAPFAGWFFDRQERKEELERLRRLADFVADVAEGATICFRTVPHPARRDMIAGEPPLLPLTPDRFAYLGDALNQYCDLCTDFGLAGAFQNRVGTFVETPDELFHVADRTDPALVKLAPDLGHWAYAGGDIRTLIRDLGARISYLRLKDFDQRVFDAVREERLGFGSFLARGGFKVLGEGTLPLEEALLPLADTFGGWVAVDLERVNAGRPPKESVSISRAYLRDHLRW